MEFKEWKMNYPKIENELEILNTFDSNWGKELMECETEEDILSFLIMLKKGLLNLSSTQNELLMRAKQVYLRGKLKQIVVDYYIDLIDLIIDKLGGDDGGD